MPGRWRLVAAVVAGLLVAVVAWLALRSRGGDAPEAPGGAPLPDRLLAEW